MLQHQMQHTNAMSYRPPNGQIDLFEKIFKYVFSITKNSNKVHYNVENFNLNLLDHENNRKIQDFLLSIIFSAMALQTKHQNIKTIKTGIIKSDVLDHFPICLLIPSEKVSAENDIAYIYKRIINDETIDVFTQNYY